MENPLTDQQYINIYTENKKNPVVEEYVRMADAIKIHSDGKSPGALITERRPSESPTVQTYREKIWKAVTKIPFSKIETELMKIRKSEEWNIEYNQKLVSSKLTEGETMEDYCEVNYPDFGSVTNWVFKGLIKPYLVDDNGFVVVVPQQYEVEQGSEMLEPVAWIFECSQIVKFIYDEYVILKSKVKSDYKSTDGKSVKEGDIFYVIDTERVIKFVETTPTSVLKRTFVKEVDYLHGLEVMPAFQIGGKIKEVIEGQIIYESRIAPCCIEFDEAVREYSDLQAEVVQHIHSEKWVIANQKCTQCHGNGKVLSEGKDKVLVDCPKCKGKGVVPTSPYENTVITPAKIDDQPIPMPPMGYVQKSVEIVRIQDERVAGHILKGLSAINMEFLAQVPLNQSGTAKEVDRDGLNTFVNAVAEDLVAVMDKVYFLIGEYRNRIRIPDRKERLAQLPSIAVPEHFDFMYSQFVIQKLTNARNAKLHPSIIAALELEYANQEFNANEPVRELLDLSYSLDPFPGIGEDDKIQRLSNKGITQLDYIISSNLNGFIKRAMIEVAGFADKLKKDQMVIMVKYAEEQIKKQSEEAQVKADLAAEAFAANQSAMGNQQPAIA